VRVRGVGGVVDSVRAETGVLWREAEQRSLFGFFELVPFFPAGAMVRRGAPFGPFGEVLRGRTGVHVR
jgi:hypothetical protein